MKIYILTENNWDHHEIHSVYKSKKKAEETAIEYNTNPKTGKPWPVDSEAHFYCVEEHEVKQ